MSNLTVRVITALLGLPLVLVPLWYGGAAFQAVVLIIAAAALCEFLSITGFAADRKAYAFGLALGLAVAVATTTAPLKFMGPVLVAAALVSFLWHLFFFGEMPTAAARAALMLFGAVYAGILPTFLFHLRALAHGFGWVFMVLAIVWMADTGAYFSGRAFGKRKLYPAVSPGKTWAGAVGGLAASVAGAFLTRWLFLPGLTPLHCVIIAVPASALGQAGDLCESLLKRAYGVKDSGRTIPGHGGMLDRFDAIFFAAPYVWVAARLLQ